MPHFLFNLRDMLIGLGPMIITIIIVLFLRLVGVIKEEHEKGTKLTKKQVKNISIWLLSLTFAMGWALYTLTLKPL